MHGKSRLWRIAIRCEQIHAQRQTPIGAYLADNSRLGQSEDLASLRHLDCPENQSAGQAEMPVPVLSQIDASIRRSSRAESNRCTLRKRTAPVHQFCARVYCNNLTQIAPGPAGNAAHLFQQIWSATSNH